MLWVGPMLLLLLLLWEVVLMAVGLDAKALEATLQFDGHEGGVVGG